MPGPFGENTMTEIKVFFDTPENPLKEGEFKEFWMSLTDEERKEFRKANLKA